MNPIVLVAVSAALLACGKDSSDRADSGVSMDGGTAVDAMVLDAALSEAGRFEAHFSDLNAGPDTVLESLVADLFAQASAGSTVRASLYTFTRMNMADAIIAAHDRGVVVHVVIDGATSVFPAFAALAAALGDQMTVCGGACIGTNINHNKFFLFEELENGDRNVVVQSSANLTTTQLSMHNNIVIARDTPMLFTAYAGYWNKLNLMESDPNLFLDVATERGSRLRAFPRQAGDSVVEILDDVDCSQGGAVHVAMAFFTNARVSVANALSAVGGRGCTVRVALNSLESGEAPGDQVIAALAENVEVLFYPDAGQGIHSKYLLINSLFRGSTEPRALVFTGSHNYTGNALRANDETLLRIESETVYQSFVADWQEIASRSASRSRQGHR